MNNIFQEITFISIQVCSNSKDLKAKYLCHWEQENSRNRIAKIKQNSQNQLRFHRPEGDQP